jgi:hypothetical protein
MAGYDLTVEDCESCPFYERTAFSAVADLITKPATQTGTCKHAADGRPFPWGRVHVADTKNPPPTCPLRGGVTTIRLKTKTP